MRAALDSGDQRSGARRTANVDRGSDQASLPGVETPARFKGHDRRPPRLRRKTQTELEERVIPTPSLFLILVPNPSPMCLPRPPLVGGRKLGEAGSDLRANRCRVRVQLPHLQCDTASLAISAIPRDMTSD